MLISMFKKQDIESPSVSQYVTHNSRPMILNLPPLQQLKISYIQLNFNTRHARLSMILKFVDSFLFQLTFFKMLMKNTMFYYQQTLPCQIAQHVNVKSQ